MSVIQLDFRKIARLVLSILAGLLVIASLQRAARANEPHVIVIPADDGYGIQDCLLQRKGCGEIVAAAWCEAEGYSTPIAFGRAEDITGTSPGSQGAKLAPNSFIVKCAD